MYAILIKWVVLGNVQLVAIEQPAFLETCQAARAEAVTTATVKAAACITRPEMLQEALDVGGCRHMPESPNVYICNGRLPKWN